MNTRRQFFQTAGFATLSAATLPSLSAASSPHLPRGSFSVDGPSVRIFSPQVKKTHRILFASDTHLTFEDERDHAWKTYGERMAKAHQKKKHFLTGNDTSPQASFEELMDLAQDYDALILGGDILNFPSFRGVEWLMEKLSVLKTPWRYVAGNHDWHYEGLPGSSKALREAWIAQRLMPLYQGHDPLQQSLSCGGELDLVLIDNSTYEVSAEQKEFFVKTLSQKRPTLLFQHIPFYAQGRSVGYGCAHPAWGAESDKHFAIERRPRWPEAGHHADTFAYRKHAIEATHLLGTFSGHVHRFGTDSIDGLPQHVVKEHACGAYYSIEVSPSES